MAKALKIGAVVVGVAALAIVTGGAAAGLGISLATGIGASGITAGTLLLASTALSAGAALLQGTPKVPAAQTERLFANIDPRTFRKTVLGQTAFPIDVRYEEWSGKDQEFCDWIICFASHAIDGLEEIWFNTEPAWTRTGGVQGKFRGYFDLPNLVLEGTPGNAFSFASGKWNGSTRLTGCAYARFRFKMTGNGKKAESPFASGIPSRITAIGRGAKLYDPRRDSTVPGGNGPMRADDQSTWRYTADDGAVIGENLPLQILRVVLGWRIRNPVTGEMRLATGSGVPGRRLLLSSFIDGANLADEMVNRSAGGQEPRYHGAAVVSEGDDPKTTLDMLCAACCGRFRDTGGRLSFVIAHNDLAAAATDDGLNDDDVIGAFTWDPDPALEATPNIVRGRYVDATTASLYQLIDYPEVRLASPDGQDRVLPLDLGAVESPSQAQRVAKQVLQRRQYQREFTSTFDIRAWKYGVGDVVPFTFAPLSFTRALFRVKAQELTQDGSCAMTLTVEHPSLYLWDASDSAPVQAAEPIVYDSRNNPLILAIDDAATTADWDKITDPIGTKPADNATNGADPNSPFGPDGKTVGDVQLAVDAARAQQRYFDEVTIPAVNGAVADAQKRVADAEKSLTDVVQRVTETEISPGGGGNLLSNTDWSTDASGWQFNSEAGSNGARDGYTAASWWPLGMHALVIAQENASQERAGHWSTAVHGIEPGKSYQASVFVASHRCNTSVYLDFYDWAGNFIPGGNQTFFSDAAPGGGIDGYNRIVGNFVAPPGTARINFYLIKYGTYEGGNSYAWFLRPQLSQVRAGVTAAVPYTPGSGDAGQLALTARVSTVEKAATDGLVALGQRTTSVEAAVSGPVAGSINPNPAFVGWANPDAPPNGWEYWNVIDKVNRISNPLNRGGYAVEQTPTNENSGIVCNNIFVPNGWYVMDVIVRKMDGSWIGAGVTLSGQQGIDFVGTPDNAGGVGDLPNGVRAWSYLFEVRDDYIGPGFKNWHAMTNWGGWGRGFAAKSLWWMHCGLRAASQGEIEARKATSVTIPAVSARVAAAENTLADLPNRYAAASRTETLEAQVNFALDSGLKRSLEATVESRATAIANGAAGSVAQTVEGIRANFEGRIAGVEVAAGAIAAVDGRTEYYWQVTGTAPDGNAMIRLAKKDGSAPVFYVGANMIVDGSLLVTGSIDSLQVRDNAITGVAWGGGGTLFTSGGGVGGQVKTIDSNRLALAVTGRRVRIDYQFSGHQSPDFVSSANSTATVFLMQSNNGGAPFQVGNRRVQLEYGNLKYFNGFELTMPPAGTTEVFMRMQVYFANNGTAAWEVFDVLLTLEETKK